MQLDLQSVEKVSFSTFAWVFTPKMLKIWASSPQNDSGAFSKIYPELFAASGAQLQEITVSTFSIQLGQYDFLFDPVGSKKCWRWFPATGPLEKRETSKSYLTQLDRNSADGDYLQLGPWRSWKQLWIDLGESSDSLWGEEDQFPAFSRQKLTRTYWKVFFQRTANPTAQ